MWGSIIEVFIRTLPSLFDSYVNPTDSHIELLNCVELPISFAYIQFITKTYHRHPELIKQNFSQVLFVIERLILMHKIQELRHFLRETILKHFETATDIEALVQMLIRVCPLIPKENRNEMCKEILSMMTSKLHRTKCPKNLAPLLFEFSLILLDLQVVKAPLCAKELLEKQEFYPWKDLASRFPDLIRFCSAYGQVETGTHFSDLGCLSDILRIIAQRAKAYQMIYRITHDEVLQVIFRWTGVYDKTHGQKISGTHVYEMAEAMLDLIDQRQVTVDLCRQFIEVLRIRIAENEANEDENMNDLNIKSFFMVRNIMFN